MKTEVIMQRELFGMTISQKSKSEFFSATDLVKAGDKWRRANDMSDFNLSAYLSSKSTKEFIDSLKEKTKEDPIIKGRGKGTHTWVHPFLFIDIALAISPKLKIETYAWIFDKLIQYRNDSGDSYKKMCGSLYLYAKNKHLFNKNIQAVANLIKIECGVKDWNEASEKQLKLRDLMHEFISFACDIVKDSNVAIEIGIQKAKQSLSV